MNIQHRTKEKNGGCILEPNELAHVLVDAITDRLGSDIAMLDMQAVSLLADYFIICSADSTPQFTAIVDEIEKQAWQEQQPWIDPLPPSCEYVSL